jgi:hypothetical protein
MMLNKRLSYMNGKAEGCTCSAAYETYLVDTCGASAALWAVCLGATRICDPGVPVCGARREEGIEMDEQRREGKGREGRVT